MEGVIEWRPASRFRYPDQAILRRVSMAESAYRHCPPDGPASADGLRGGMLANARVALLGFVAGDELENGVDLRCFEPWSIGVGELKANGGNDVAVRFIGWFVEKDHFFVSHIVPRRDLPHRRHEPGWIKTIDKCIDRRRRLFARQLILVAPIERCVSNLKR